MPRIDKEKWQMGSSYKTVMDTYVDERDYKLLGADK